MTVALRHATWVRFSRVNTSDRTNDELCFSCLEHSHALVDIFHLFGRVGYASVAFSTPSIQEEDDPGSERRYLWRHVSHKLNCYVN
jgi:hypothetical protein